jgi:putative cell wall-binding protein
MHTSFDKARGARRFGLAVIAGTIALVGLVPAAQADLRVGQNYRLASDSNPFRGKDQVALAVDPANRQHIVATNANYLTEDCEATTSFDGGKTWSEAVPLQSPPAGIGLPFLPSCRISNHLGESMFQTVAFGSGQSVYAVSITPRSAVSAAGEEGASAIVYKSTNGGLSWGSGIIAMAGGAAGSPYYELPTVAVDPGAGPGAGDRVYVAAHETTGFNNSVSPPCPAAVPPAVPRCPSVHVAVSNDGAATFAAPVQASAAGVPIAGPDSSSNPVINPDHSVSIAWRTQGINGTIQVARSTDAGVTWGAPVDVANVSNTTARASTSHVTPAPSTGSSFPRMTGDPRNGNLYIVYNQGAGGPTAPAGGFQGADHFIAPDSHVYFQRSLNAGATWSTPKLIDDITPHPGTPIVQTRHPSVSVAPDGRVDIVWEDRRHWYQGPGEHNCIHTHIACDDARLGDTYYSYSTDAGATFEVNRRISDRSHNNDVGYDYRFGTAWAFGPQAVSISSDELLVAWMDSREGSVDDDNQDLYLAKVMRGAPTTVPQSRIDQPGPVALSVALSQQTYQGGGEALLASTFATRPATNVVIVNEDDVAGAAAGGVLARANLGPVLLSPAGGLPAAVRAEIARLSPTRVYVVGDGTKLSGQVEADAASAAGLSAANVVRLAGANDAGTAALIAAAVDRRTDAEKATHVPAFDAVVIANPASTSYVAASALAAARRLPLLFVNSGSIPPETAAALTSLDVNASLVIGNTSEVGTGPASALPGATTRLGGADVFATSKAVVGESLARGLPSNVVYAASADRPMDAALLGFAVGRSTGILELTPGAASQTAAATTQANALPGVDRIIAVEPSPPGAAAATPAPAAVPPGAVPKPAVPAACGQPRLVKRNASKTRSRIDMRVRQACNGKLTATAKTRLRVKGRLRFVSQRTSVRKLSGLNRSIRVTLSKAAQRRLRQTRVLRVPVRMVFTPTTLSSNSRKSTRTINVTIRLPKKKSSK